MNTTSPPRQSAGMETDDPKPLSLANVCMNSFAVAYSIYSPPKGSLPILLRYLDEVDTFVRGCEFTRQHDYRAFFANAVFEDGDLDHCLSVQATIRRMERFIDREPYFLYCIHGGLIGEGRKLWEELFKGKYDASIAFCAGLCSRESSISNFVQSFVRYYGGNTDLPYADLVKYASKHGLIDLFLVCLPKLSVSEKLSISHRCIVSCMLSLAKPRVAVRFLDAFWRDDQVRTAFDPDKFCWEISRHTTTDDISFGYGLELVSHTIYDILCFQNRSPFAELGARLLISRLGEREAKIVDLLIAGRLERNEMEGWNEQALKAYLKFRKMDNLSTEEAKKLVRNPHFTFTKVEEDSEDDEEEENSNGEKNEEGAVEV